MWKYLLMLFVLLNSCLAAAGGGEPKYTDKPQPLACLTAVNTLHVTGWSGSFTNSCITVIWVRYRTEENPSKQEIVYIVGRDGFVSINGQVKQIDEVGYNK